ncbi:hypothetical protein RZE82_08030 [Mollicutes bacterium LVI A0039]|nr:hypothetical protein RZE82_08030 [Mollicutes bacterium LVI A0039]
MLDINLDDVTFDCDKSNLKYHTSNCENLEFSVGDLIGFNHYWDLCETLNKMGKWKTTAFK